MKTKERARTISGFMVVVAMIGLLYLLLLQAIARRGLIQTRQQLEAPKQTEVHATDSGGRRPFGTITANGGKNAFIFDEKGTNFDLAVSRFLKTHPALEPVSTNVVVLFRPTQTRN